VRNETVRGWLGPVAVLGALVVGCSRDAGEGGGRADPVPVPGTEWVIESPEDNGMDPAVLDRARSYAFSEGMNTQGVVVVRHGVIVAEWYAGRSDAESWAASWSVAKSFTSALIGIAIEEGKIPGVDEPMTTYYPWQGAGREGITLRDVLQMSSGLEWTEDYDPAAISSSDIIQMVLFQPDQLAYASGRPLESEPGTDWNYSSGDTMLLSGVIEQATGLPVDEYAREKLFEPIGMEQAEWWRDARGHTLTYCCLDTTSRDFARFGLLYLRDGEWGTEQVVESSWVDESLERAPGSADVGYGYQWWLAGVDGAPDDLFAARGHDGQYIFVIPSLDLVVVRNGTYVKDPGEPIADPNLFGKYPSDGLVPGRGTDGPEHWDDAAFLAPIIESVTGA
jgi:CubicO group peptidase (beta-lactamase class C family)